MKSITTEEWAKAVMHPGTIRPEERSPWVEMMQRALAMSGWPLGTDGIYGPRTEDAVGDYQYARMLPSDGVCGPITKADISRALADGWALGSVFHFQGAPMLGGVESRYGRIPSRGGRMSTFGGPDDAGDRGYGQAFVSVHPEGSVEALYSQRPELVELGLFTAGLEDPLPMTTCCGHEMRAGISWCLDPDSFYVALPFRRRGPQPDPEFDRVILVHDGNAVNCALTDRGPHERTGRVVDISPGAADGLYLKPGDGKLLRTDSEVLVAWAKRGAPLGPVAMGS